MRSYYFRTLSVTAGAACSVPLRSLRADTTNGSSVGFTCSSDAVFPSVQTPNGNADADTEISPSSHEVMEAVTDPDTTTGWFDSSGFENGDECAYVFGTTKGATGAVYNQTINGHHYLTQEEFSNNNFKRTGGGCLQGS